MATITAFEAKTRFGELLERVSRGEEIVITRHDQPVARIVPEGKRRLNQVRAAVRDLRALQQEIAKRNRSKPISDKEIRDAINEGRPLATTSSPIPPSQSPGSCGNNRPRTATFSCNASTPTRNSTCRP